MIYSEIMKKARLAIKRADDVIDDIRPAYGNEKIVKGKDGRPRKSIVINEDITDYSAIISNAVTVFLKNGDKIVYIAKEDNERT